MTFINIANGNGNKSHGANGANGAHVSNGANGSNGSNGKASRPANWIAVDPTKFAFTPRKLRVVCIGAGISGLTLAHDIMHKKGAGYEEYIDLAIYDKNHEIGGTWIEHNYPGLRCDAPSHVYIFPFEPNVQWSEFYSSGTEIQAYIERTADKYGLREHVQLNSKVLESIWDGDRGKWKLKIEQGGRTIQDECDVLVSAVGWLNKWEYPKIPGIHKFKGALMHAASWDPSFDYTGKKVAVIGNGSAGIQIFTEVAKKAAKTVNFNRHNTWITSNIAAQYTPEGRNFAYSPEQIAEWKQHPDKFFAYRKELEAGLNYLWPMMIKDGAENLNITELSRKIMTQRLGGSADLAEHFIPKHAFGCRRLTPGDGYLETCTQSKTARAELSSILRVTETGIETAAGGHEEFDLIGCATGYIVDFVPSWKVVGLDGFDLNEAWERDGATGYFAVCVPKVPNFFMYHGPNAPVGQGSILRAQGWYTDYILQWIERIAKEDIKCVSPKKEVTDDYNVVQQENLKRTVWSGDCPGWYKGTEPSQKNRGVVALYGGSILHFKACLERIRGEDFEFQYCYPQNRFSFLGNGETARERGKGGDLSYYMDPASVSFAAIIDVVVDEDDGEDEAAGGLRIVGSPVLVEQASRIAPPGAVFEARGTTVVRAPEVRIVGQDAERVACALVREYSKYIGALFDNFD